MRLIILIGLFLSLLACGAKNTKDLKQTNINNGLSFTVNDNYEAVYRNLLAQAKQCWTVNMITAQMIVQNDLYPSQKTAEISSVMQDSFGTHVYELIEIKALDENLTKVTNYYYRGKAEATHKRIKGWALENSRSCS